MGKYNVFIGLSDKNIDNNFLIDPSNYNRILMVDIDYFLANVDHVIKTVKSHRHYITKLIEKDDKNDFKGLEIEK